MVALIHPHSICTRKPTRPPRGHVSNVGNHIGFSRLFAIRLVALFFWATCSRLGKSRFCAPFCIWCFVCSGLSCLRAWQSNAEFLQYFMRSLQSPCLNGLSKIDLEILGINFWQCKVLLGKATHFLRRRLQYGKLYTVILTHYLFDSCMEPNFGNCSVPNGRSTELLKVGLFWHLFYNFSDLLTSRLIKLGNLKYYELGNSYVFLITRAKQAFFRQCWYE